MCACACTCVVCGVCVCVHVLLCVKLHAASCSGQKSGHLLKVCCSRVVCLVRMCCQYCMYVCLVYTVCIVCTVCIVYCMHCMYCMHCLLYALYVLYALYTVGICVYPSLSPTYHPYHREWRPVHLGKSRPPPWVLSGGHQAAQTTEGGCHGVWTCAGCRLWQPAHRWSV